ncbi:MAG: dihydrodipicolinate synthase family protein [Phycisphaerae bacterium]|nr:dihydrodipicolinate synthase family protein [Phycisphaerae bacterium]
MNRKELIEQTFPDGVDALWCPLLTHYIVRYSHVTVDRRRMAAQLRTLTPYVRRFLLGGSTGDGWDLNPQQFNDLLAFAEHEPYWTWDTRFLVGALCPSTAEVVRRVQIILSRLGDGRAPNFAGLTVCPPVDPSASQQGIHDHYARVAQQAGSVPLAVYQLPQVTGCEIEPATLAALVEEFPNICLFKDSSGTDTVARTGQGLDGMVLLRGAEGHYAEALKTNGGLYDGLLLSTANVLAYSLWNLVDLASGTEKEVTQRRSEQLTRLAERLFKAVAACSTGNAFSNASRAVDHLVAHGAYWNRVEPPMLFDGSRLPVEVLRTVAALFDEAEEVPEHGYFLHRYVGLE